jgi:maltose O-acetyltransferase
MATVRRIMRAVAVRLANGASNTLADDPISKRVRLKIYSALGCSIKSSAVLSGGTYVNGVSLSVGHGSRINRSVYFDLNASVTIGDNVSVGHHAKFITAEHSLGNQDRRCGSTTAKAIVIKNGAWVGAGAIIMPGVIVEAGSVVAAGAVVTKSVSANTLVGGVPARFIRRLEVS